MNWRLAYRARWTDNNIESWPKEKLALDFENKPAARGNECAVNLFVVRPCKHGVPETNEFRGRLVENGSILRCERVQELGILEKVIETIQL